MRDSNGCSLWHGYRRWASLCYTVRSIEDDEACLVHVKIKNFVLNTKTPKILAGTLALLLVFEWGLGVRTARQLERVTEPRELPILKAPEPVKHVKQHQAVRVDFFGKYTPHAVVNAGGERSKINVSIIGILYASDENASQVLIDVPGHDNKVFKVGDTLPGGAMIKRISPEGIVVMRGESMENLSLPTNQLNFAPPLQPMVKR